MLGAGSVATDIRWVVFMPFVLKHSKIALQISSPRVWSFSGIKLIIYSCGPAEFTYRQNSAICSISLLSLDSSQVIEYATAEFTSFICYLVMSSAILEVLSCHGFFA